MLAHTHAGVRARACGRTHTAPRSCVRARAMLVVGHTQAGARAHLCGARRVAAPPAMRGVRAPGAGCGIDLRCRRYGSCMMCGPPVGCQSPPPVPRGRSAGRPGAARCIPGRRTVVLPHLRCRHTTMGGMVRRWHVVRRSVLGAVGACGCRWWAVGWPTGWLPIALKCGSRTPQKSAGRRARPFPRRASLSVPRGATTGRTHRPAQGPRRGSPAHMAIQWLTRHARTARRSSGV